MVKLTVLMPFRIGMDIKCYFCLKRKMSVWYTVFPTVMLWIRSGLAKGVSRMTSAGVGYLYSPVGMGAVVP